MAKRKGAAALAAFLAAAALGTGSLGASGENDCTGSPPEAAMTVPAPLDKWGEIACTPFGHVLANKRGWVWILPSVRRPVFLPSQMVDRFPQPLGNKSYFVRIEATRARGEEAERAYEIFHEGFDPNETPPDVYRVDLVSVSGRAMRLYFFDYGTYAWGMECRAGGCDRGSRFMILDKDHMPVQREPTI